MIVFLFLNRKIIYSITNSNREHMTMTLRDTPILMIQQTFFQYTTINSVLRIV